MKNFITLFLVLCASIGFSQNNPIDFEPGGYGADWTWTVFENESNPPLEIIDNPDPNGINTSATVAKFTALEAGNPWAGTESEHGVDLGTFEWSDDNRIVKIMVWKSVISDVGIKFATEAGWAQEELKVSNTVTEEWEELTFDFSDFINPPAGGDDDLGTLGQIIIFPDYDDRDQDNIVYFDNITFHPAEVGEGEDASLSDLMVDGTTVEGFSPSVLNYSVVLPEGTTDVPVVTATTNDPDASADITPAAELPGTTSVLVTSANTEVERTYTVNFTVGAVSGEPEVAAPAPPARDPENVISIFSDAYTNVEGTDFNPDWEQSTMVSIVEIQGNETLKYENFNYQGTQFAGSIDVSGMETLHLDMWTADATSVNVFCISEGPVETAFALEITPNEWVSYDIPLSAFDDVDMTGLIQFKFDGGDGSPTIYLDNLYFFKEPTSIGSTEQAELILYPNPVEAGGTIHLSAEASMVEIFDLTGKLIHSDHHTSTIQNQHMNRGIYIMRIHTQEGYIKSQKLVVR